jgi:hypothetical protein
MDQGIDGSVEGKKVLSTWGQPGVVRTFHHNFDEPIHVSLKARVRRVSLSHH